MGVYIKNWSLADWKELLKWAKIGANNAMIGEFTEVEEVPPHGRLGDLDALIEEVIAKYLGHERKGELVFAAAEIKQDIVDLISDAPTIIPASEEGE